MPAIVSHNIAQRMDDRGFLSAVAFGDVAMLRVFSADDSGHQKKSHRQTVRAKAMQRARRNRLAAGGETIPVAPQTTRLTMADIRPAHRINSPVRVASKSQDFSKPSQGVPVVGSEASAVVGAMAPVDPRILELSKQVAAADVRLVVPVHQRELFASLPLRAWYECPLYGPSVQRLKDIEAKKTASGTMAKDLSAISVFERYTRPADWSGEWPGISISAIGAEYLREWIRNALAAGKSKGYLDGLAGHLTWILRLAVEREVLVRAPKKPPVKQIATAVRSTLFSDDDLTVIYETNGQILETLDRIHANLAGNYELQTAFVVACSCGLRPSDLFSLCWRDVNTIDGTPAIFRVPQKTKRHGTTVRIPLAPCVSVRLAELRRRAEQNRCGTGPDETADSAAADFMASERLFPSLVSSSAKDPEKSHAARRRNAELRKAAQAAGFIFPDRRSKPWQIARATCNERLERHCAGIGEFVLGHASGSVNAKSYRKRWSEAVTAVQTLPQPAGFLEVISPEISGGGI